MSPEQKRSGDFSPAADFICMEAAAYAERFIGRMSESGRSRRVSQDAPSEDENAMKESKKENQKTTKKENQKTIKRNPAVTDGEIAEILDRLRLRGESVTTVESITAGMISARLADIPGCSDVMERAFVTYCDAAKHEMVQVKKKTLKKWTAVSRQCAKQMAKGGASKAGASACVSATGYAGPPSGPEDKTAGLVYIGCRYHDKTVVEEHHYSGQRNEVRSMAMNDALRLLHRMVV